MKRKNNRKFAIFTALTALWMIVIFLFSPQPAEESYKTSDIVLALQQEYFDMFFKKLTPFIIRKAAHMAEFGLLALLSLETLKNSGFRFFTNAVRFNYFTAALLFTSFYAFTDEHSGPVGHTPDCKEKTKKGSLRLKCPCDSEKNVIK